MRILKHLKKNINSQLGVTKLLWLRNSWPQQSPIVATEVLEQVQFGLLHERCIQVDYRA